MKERVLTLCARIAMTAIVLHVLLVVVSWVITAARPGAAVRSLLSGEGLRWFVGSFVENQLSPLLVWLLLLAMAAGAAWRSGLVRSLRRMRRLTLRERIALRFVLVELVIVAIIVLLLTSVPHAVLLNVSGNLIPGSFSRAIVPITSFAVCLIAVTYHNVVHNHPTATDMFKLIVDGVAIAAPLLTLYVLLTSLYHTTRFVFMM